MGLCATQRAQEAPQAAAAQPEQAPVPEHLAFLLRPIALNVQPNIFSLTTGSRVPQDLRIVLRGRSFDIRAIVDTGCMRSIIVAPADFFANLHVTVWGTTPILGRNYDTKEMMAALAFNGTTFPRVELSVTNRNIQGNDGFEWQGIIGMDVMLKCSVYMDKGRFLILAYEDDISMEAALI